MHISDFCFRFLQCSSQAQSEVGLKELIFIKFYKVYIKQPPFQAIKCTKIEPIGCRNRHPFFSKFSRGGGDAPDCP